jgi:hypothetical protein
MTDQLIYNIPIEMIDRFRGQRIIVRTYDPAKLIENLSETDLEYLQYVEIQTLSTDVSVLANWGEGIPLDIQMCDPEVEFGKLYDYAKLLDKHPLRIAIPVQVGFANAVSIAASLNFAIKLIVSQPGPGDLVEMSRALDTFLHRPTFTQPIEFYQSLLRSFFQDEPNTIWAIQEEDPARIRYITAAGKETISPRFRDVTALSGRGLETFIEEFLLSLLFERSECATCEFMTHCGGYFKWPDRNYVCSGGVINVFKSIKKAAGELKSDLAVYAEPGEELQP